MNKRLKILSIIFSMIILTSCSQPDTSTYTPSTPDSPTCATSFAKLLETDGFRYSSNISRGGKNNDQLTLDLIKQTAAIKDPSTSYNDGMNDGVVLLFDYENQLFTDSSGTSVDNSQTKAYKEHLNELFDKYNTFIVDSGCASEGFTIDKFSKFDSIYPTNEKILEEYLNEYSEFLNMVACKGTECSVKDSELFVSLDDYSDLSLPLSKHLNNDGKMIKKINNDGYVTNNLVGFNVIMTYDEFNKVPVSYDNSLSLMSNPLYVQNFVRDIYFKYSSEVGPYLYFVYIDGNEKNKEVDSEETSLDYTEITYENWKQNLNNSMHQFWQDEEGAIEYKMSNLSDTEITNWLWNRLKESKNNDISDELYQSYMRIYDYSWQKMMGLREKYYNDFGI